jgi:hypothetical protein
MQFADHSRRKFQWWVHGDREMKGNPQATEFFQESLMAFSCRLGMVFIAGSAVV